MVCSPVELITAGFIFPIAAALTYPALVSQAGIIHWALGDHKNNESSLKQHIKAGIQQSVRVISIHLVHIGIMLLCVSVIAFPIIGIFNLAGILSPQLSVVIFATVLLPCGLISHALRKFSIIALFTGKQHTLSALFSSFKLFSAHWKQTLECIALLLCASLALSFAYITALIVVLFPIASVGVVLMLLDMTTSGFIVLGATGIIALLGLFLFGAFWATCSHVVWVFCYKQLHHPIQTKFKERIEHLLSFHISR